MPVVNYIVALALVLLLNYSGRIAHFREKLLAATISCAVFVNVGFFVTEQLSYATLMMVVYIAYSLCDELRIEHDLKISPNSLITLLLICVFSLIGVLVANTLSKSIEIIPVKTWMDDVYYGRASLEHPSITFSNITVLVRLGVFGCFVCLAAKYITSKDSLVRISSYLIKCFHLFFVLGIVECLINNFIPGVFREVILNAFGVADPNITYKGAARNGLYGFMLLFTEQSYVSVVLIYYSLIFAHDEEGPREVIWLAISIVALVLNGSTSGLALIPFGLITLFAFVLKMKDISQKNKGVMALSAALLLFTAILILFGERTVSVADSAVSKLMAFVNDVGNTQDIQAQSASIRRTANAIALEAFYHSPLFGMGLGTTRAFGLGTSALVCLGIAGCTSYVAFLINEFHLRLAKPSQVFLAVINIMYLLLFFNISYLYSPAMVALILPFCHSKNNCNRIGRQRLGAYL